MLFHDLPHPNGYDDCFSDVFYNHDIDLLVTKRLHKLRRVLILALIWAIEGFQIVM